MNVKSLFVLGLGALAFAACSNDDDPVEKQDETVVVNLAKQADYTIYSGETTLKTSFGATRANMPTGETYTIDTDQAEVNLSVNAPRENTENPYDYVATKLSIHLRYATDAEVFIPVSKDLYCDADDMAIVKNHAEGNYVYNTDPHTVTMNIGGKDVTLTVAYEDEGIRVTTSGMDADVLAYTEENYNDGLTFEVWNYYNADADRDEIKALADESEVTLEATPGFYINGFNELPKYNGKIYSKEGADGLLYPYTDEECTQELDDQYWTRPNDKNGDPSKDYALAVEKNENDCVVVPTNTDLALSDMAIRSQFNVVYTKYNDQKK